MDTLFGDDDIAARQSGLDMGENLFVLDREGPVSRDYHRRACAENATDLVDL